MKKVALINDLSGFGKCSLTAAIPVISIMGLQACPLPTAVLSAQTGFPSFYCDDFTDKMDFFTTEWQKLDVHFDGIHSGYLASPAQRCFAPFYGCPLSLFCSLSTTLLPVTVKMQLHLRFIP